MSEGSNALAIIIVLLTGLAFAFVAVFDWGENTAEERICHFYCAQKNPKRTITKVWFKDGCKCSVVMGEKPKTGIDRQPKSNR